MKVLVSWLRELVDVPVPIPTLAHDLHMAGFEVASVTPVGSDPIQPVGLRSDPLQKSERGLTPTDAVIDFEITANRPDCLSMIGLAREVATRYGTPLRTPPERDLGPASQHAAGPLTVTIEDPDRCPRYCAALADVKIGPSPAWLADRLVAAGVRSISNIVDITNYVLLELGHPLHAFDLAKLAGPQLRIRTARPGEALTTLDGQKRTLADDMLVIADGQRAQALAGVMGGGDSEVSSGTATIVLEAAWFLPASIRRTSKRLGLSTEASYRFERGADFAAPPDALARACALIEQIGAGHARSGWIDACPGVRPPVVLTLELARVGRVLGADVSAADIRRILTGLGFVLSGETGGVISVSVPSWRVDVSRDIDLIEEVARHFGYDRLPPTFPALTTVPPRPDPRLEQNRAIRRLTSAAGFSEAVTFSFIAEKNAREFASESPLVAITNPLSETFAVLRPSLLPGLVDAVAHNSRHGQKDVRLFELGTRFLHDGGESRTLSFAMTGAALAEHWSARPRPVDFFDASGVVEWLCQALGLTVLLTAAERPYLARGRCASVAVVADNGDTREIGVVGQLRPELADARDVPAQDEIYVAELDIDAAGDLIAVLAIPRSRPLPRFPSIVRDVSILVNDTLKTGDVRGTIRSAAPATLWRVTEFDRYQGKGIPEGKVSLSYRLTFQAPDRTLTDAEADAATAAIVEALGTAHDAQRR